ncbi:uncharacterized protein [Watersipora subatra]|uniref:uncharacterized protein n=1 Tax=Watersipora subatra TaxID=2589382 RepID=UPI00355B7018
MDTRFVVEQVETTNKNVCEFRKFTRRVVGAGLSVPDNNLLFFGYRQSHEGFVSVLVCVGTIRPASKVVKESLKPLVTNCWELEVNDTSLVSNRWAEEAEGLTPSDAAVTPASGATFTENNFLTDDSHIVEYLFTDPYYRQEGYGSQLLHTMERCCYNVSNVAPFKLWAASKARKFFQHQGYVSLDNKPSVSSNMVHIFRHLYPMQKLSFTDLPQKRRRKHHTPSYRPA